MNTLSRSRLTGAVGAFTAIAGVVLVAAIVVPPDPLGRLVGALIGASLFAGIAGTFVRETLKRRDLTLGRSVSQPKALAAASTMIAMPGAADATASELDGENRPAFAPVISLTEEQVERARAARKRRERRETLTGA